MKTLHSYNLQERIDELELDFRVWKDSLTPEQIAAIYEEFDVADGIYEASTDEEKQRNLMWKWESFYAEELKNLLDLRENFGREWKDGVELILEKDFEEYAQDHAESIGAIDRNASWPLNHINWDFAAEDLKSDYSSVDYDGETYYYRE